ncbi:hypothetical protein HELRODRAFT_174989 [Helobdella robusta]|uniref:VWA N-terminal domain-containing protein n=1 Tax=Helobdella robusta TaxID=6412 RepID=T1F8P6_HELRO|nr:hypothetical protein HELRODRAFT_174989 [Helobdella robusta]ESO01430.1 hypothetical protein HELRODRAFT_174989 [Helobdella robusta]
MMTKKRKKIKITITTIVWKFLILFLNFGISTCDELNLPLHSIIKFSDHFGQSVYDKVAKATAIMDLKILKIIKDYLLLEPNVKQVDGQSLTSDMKRAVQKMLHRKLIALHSLSNMSDVSFRQHIFDPTLRMTYPESKNLNYTDFILVRSAQFNDMTVNFTMSTVHIPNSVYEKSSDVLNGVAWSASLDDTFKRNNERDEHLKWQYFCSSTGFLRMYPVFISDEYVCFRIQ